MKESRSKNGTPIFVSHSLEQFPSRVTRIHEVLRNENRNAM